MLGALNFGAAVLEEATFCCGASCLPSGEEMAIGEGIALKAVELICLAWLLSNNEGGEGLADRVCGWRLRTSLFILPNCPYPPIGANGFWTVLVLADTG